MPSKREDAERRSRASTTGPLSNTQSARAAGSRHWRRPTRTIAWTAPTISYLVIAGFFIFLFVLVWLYWGGRSNKNNFIVQIINIAVGALTAAFATVVNFWLGSSAGSQKKDDTNLTLQQAQAERARRKPKSAARQDRPTATGGGSNAGACASAGPPQSQPISKARQNSTPACHSSSRRRAAIPTTRRILEARRISASHLATLRAYEGDPNLTADDVKNAHSRCGQGDLPDRVLEQDAVRRAAGGPRPRGVRLRRQLRSSRIREDAAKARWRDAGRLGRPDNARGCSTSSMSDDLIGRFAQARLAFYQSLNMPEFEQGWATRVAQIQSAAVKMLDASQVAVA